MNISCRKNLNGSFMVISEFGEADTDDYSLKMVMSNRIPRLLEMQQEIMDGKKRMLYDITSLDSLDTILKNGELTGECLDRLLHSLKQCADQMNRYLLDPDLLILQPDCIYADLSRRQFSFCFFPFSGEDRTSGLRAVFDRILSEIDYDDRKLVRKVYELNSRAKNPNFSIRNLCDGILEEEKRQVTMDPMFGAEDPDETEQEGLRMDAFFRGDGRGNEGYGQDGFFDASGTAHTEEPGILAKLKQYFQKRQPGGSGSGTGDPLPESAPFRAEWKSLQEILQENRPDEPSGETACETGSAESAAGCMHRLVGTGRQQGNVIEINRNPFVIGKLVDQADYLLQESVVSRMHARICFNEEEECFLEDLDSLNGTFINGVRITSRVQEKLLPGDLVTLADQEFVFQ